MEYKTDRQLPAAQQAIGPVDPAVPLCIRVVHAYSTPLRVRARSSGLVCGRYWPRSASLAVCNRPPRRGCRCSQQEGKVGIYQPFNSARPRLLRADCVNTNGTSQRKAYAQASDHPACQLQLGQKNGLTWNCPFEELSISPVPSDHLVPDA